MNKINFAPKYVVQALILVFGLLIAAKYSRGQQPMSATNSPSPTPSVFRANSLDKSLFFCTTRIETISSDGKTNGYGTGFVFNYEVEGFQGTNIIPFIVTCRHVLDGFASASFSFVKKTDGNPDLGKRCTVIIPDIKRLVFYNPDPHIDLALIPLQPILEEFKKIGQNPYFVGLDKKLVPDRGASEDLSAIQPIVFIGYPSGLHDEVNLLPIARRGFTASPYIVDFNGLPFFLIDASVFPGSSGSPVMVLDEGMYREGELYVAGSRLFFLGLVDQAYIRKSEGIVKFKPLPTQFVPVVDEEHYLNLGAVIKAKAILDTMLEFSKVYPPPSPPISVSAH